MGKTEALLRTCPDTTDSHAILKGLLSGVQTGALAYGLGPTPRLVPETAMMQYRNCVPTTWPSRVLAPLVRSS